ncbi:MAG TPA: hypothetical protein VJ583_00755 [Nitrososphaeraceae archaeon]|jgi:hypothetical protein|nr:hypothetical protein [Nitrososphaeraceae archaeon]
MVTYICSCGKNFKSKQSAKNHLEHSHKKEILDLEVRIMYKSERCVYCYKKIEGPVESHLPRHIKKIITKFFDSWMSKSSSVPSI